RAPAGPDPGAVDVLGPGMDTGLHARVRVRGPDPGPGRGRHGAAARLGLHLPAGFRASRTGRAPDAPGRMRPARSPRRPPGQPRHRPLRGRGPDNHHITTPPPGMIELAG